MCSIYKRYHFALLAVGRPDVPAGAVAVTRSVFAAPAGVLGVGFHLSIASILIAKPLSSSMLCIARVSLSIAFDNDFILLSILELSLRGSPFVRNSVWILPNSGMHRCVACMIFVFMQHV